MKKTGFPTVLLLLISTLLASAQNPMLNTRWTAISGSPEAVDWSATCLDNSGQLLTTGNSQNINQGANILTKKYNLDGTLAWQVEWNGATNGSDFGTAIYVQSNSVFVCGATFNLTNQDYDYVVLSYNLSSGVLNWSYTYLDESGGNDIPSDIVCGPAGGVFITGVRQGSTSLADYCTICLNGSGQLQWVRNYDYSSYFDIASKVVINSNNECVVTGGSGTSINNGDICSIKYSLNGDQLVVNRSQNSTLSFDQAFEITKDQSDNLYIVGKTGTSSNGFDIKVIKLNSDLSILWELSHDGYGLNDQGQSIDVDANGNAYITGHLMNDEGHKELVVLKLDAQGTILWEKRKRSAYNGDAAGCQIQEFEGNVYAVGDIKTDLNMDIIAISFDGSGNQRWIRTIDGGTGGNDSGRHARVVNDNYIYISGSVETVDGLQYMDRRFEQWQRLQTVLNDLQGNPVRIKNELVVHFSPSKINTSVIDNKEIIYSSLGDFLTEDAMVAVNTALGIEMKDQKAIKVYKKMTTADSLSTDRLGNIRDMPAHWSSLVVTLPNVLDNELALENLLALNSVVEYAGFNNVYVLNAVPNDNLVTTEQASLIATSNYPSANINIEPAWDISTGNTYIKAGILDSPIYWGHEDFGDGTYSGSKVAGGWDWTTNQPISNIDMEQITSSHATQCAGIIGALRNNQIGIAGIAGGDVDNLGSTGVQLFSLGVILDGATNTELLAEAIVEGAFDTPDFGYGLHIMNMSAGTTTTQNPDVLAALISCYRNNCVFVASRGNSGNTSVNYPASYGDQYVISVGASGTNGKYKDLSNGEENWSSSYGGGMDLIAPGTSAIVTTTVQPQLSNYIAGSGTDCSTGSDLYNCFSGSSASAPHVAGAVALLLSKHHVYQGYANNLAPEDVEYLLEHYATDIVGGPNEYPIGYDEKNGHGRLNAGAAMEKINNPVYRVFHSGLPATIETSEEPEQPLVVEQTTNGIAPGTYDAKRVTITQTFVDNFPDNTEILGVWGRESSVVGTGYSNPYVTVPWATYNFAVIGNTLYTTTVTNCWHIVGVANTDQQMDNWLPAWQNNAATPYSVHLMDHSMVQVDEIDLQNQLVIYPNPAQSSFNLSYTSLNKARNVDINIYNSLGKIVDAIRWTDLGQVLTVDTRKYGSGIYFVRLQIGDQVLVRSLVVE